jgi:hypothetical protein
LQQALDVFFNGLVGVFAGMAVLYITMKLIALTSRQQNRKKEEGE